VSRLTDKIGNGVGNAKEDFPSISGVRRVRVPGTQAGIWIDGVIYPLQGEPPVAKTKGWGRVPGT
jgi:hypothetical protein